MTRILLHASIAVFLACASQASIAAQPSPPPAATRPVLTEEAKIDALIGAVEAMPKAVFIRNGTEHSAARAAEHLRLKRRNAGKRVRTAEQFIRYCASESSLTGRKYQIRYPDGRTVDAADFFHQQLARLEAGRPLVLPPVKPAQH
jgi:hypothetical protein